MPRADARLALENRAAGQGEYLTVPARRPIKAVYIRKLVAMLEGMERDGKGD